MNYELTSKLAPVIRRYILLKRALGRDFESPAYHLMKLDRFLALHNSDLTSSMFSAWCSSLQRLSTSGRRARMLIVYNLCLYRRRTESTCFVPDPTQFPPPHVRPRPYIFSATEIRQLLHATKGLPVHPSSPLHRHIARIAVVLLYTTGLRRGELTRLTIQDYDAEERLLVIRESKFHKSRLVPLSLDAAHEMSRYFRYRLRPGLPTHADSPLLVNTHGGPGAYTGPGFAMLIRKLYRRAKIHTSAGRLPRVHDLRFTFAVHALLRWYRTGADVQAQLPALSRYMGHVSIASTQYYLSFLDDVAQEASKKFEQHCSGFLPRLCARMTS